MHMPKKLSFSIFLTLMLIQTAISVPVDNNNESKDLKPKADENPSQNPVKSDKELKDAAEKLYNEELEKVVPSDYETFSQLNPLENYKNFTEALQDSIKEKFADVKVKVDGLLSQMNPVEHSNKLKDLFETSVTNVANLYKQHLSNAKDNINGFFNLINPEDKDKA